jgi:hypothetical protein
MAIDAIRAKTLNRRANPLLKKERLTDETLLAPMVETLRFEL